MELSSKEEQNKIIEKFKTYNNIGKYNILKNNTLDGLKLYLEDGSTVLLRKSGTEPLLRIYLEASTSDIIQELKDNIKTLI